MLLPVSWRGVEDTKSALLVASHDLGYPVLDKMSKDFVTATAALGNNRCTGVYFPGHRVVCTLGDTASSYVLCTCVQRASLLTITLQAEWNVQTSVGCTSSCCHDLFSFRGTTLDLGSSFVELLLCTLLISAGCLFCHGRFLRACERWDEIPTSVQLLNEMVDGGHSSCPGEDMHDMGFIVILPSSLEFLPANTNLCLSVRGYAHPRESRVYVLYVCLNIPHATNNVVSFFQVAARNSLRVPTVPHFFACSGGLRLACDN